MLLELQLRIIEQTHDGWWSFSVGGFLGVAREAGGKEGRICLFVSGSVSGFFFVCLGKHTSVD